jgi:hypothetical protein
VLQDGARLAKVEELLSRIAGQSCKIQVAWTEDVETATVGKSPAAAAMGQQRQLRAELGQIPLVKKAGDVLNAQIIRADDGFGTAAKAGAAECEEIPEDTQGG